MSARLRPGPSDSPKSRRFRGSPGGRESEPRASSHRPRYRRPAPPQAGRFFRRVARRWSASPPRSRAGPAKPELERPSRAPRPAGDAAGIGWPDRKTRAAVASAGEFVAADQRVPAANRAEIGDGIRFCLDERQMADAARGFRDQAAAKRCLRGAPAISRPSPPRLISPGVAAVQRHAQIVQSAGTGETRIHRGVEYRRSPPRAAPVRG